MDAKLNKDNLKKGADAVIDKAPIQDQGMKDKAKDVAHQAIDKADMEQVKAMAPKAAEVAKSFLGK